MEQVYIFDFGDKIKVGFSTNVKKRLRTIELSSGVKAKQVYAVDASRWVEKESHKLLTNRLEGEFFAFPFDKAKSIVDKFVQEEQKLNSTKAKYSSMNITTKIKLAITYAKISEAELARRIGTSSQALGQRLKTGKFTSEELEKIASVIGAEYTYGFRFSDGTEI